MNFVDLHTHTIASDGTLTPSELVEEAASLAMRVIAVTDHDTTAGLSEALAAGQRYGIDVIPGVEINTDVPGGEVHILGYFINPENGDFQRELNRLREGRQRRGKGMVEKLQGLGLPITWEQVQVIAGEASIGRPHVAQALLQNGAVQTVGEAFQKYIGRDGPAYVERLRVTPKEAVSLITLADGVPIMAHPLPMGASAGLNPGFDLETFLPPLQEAGLKGLEAYYSGYSTQATERLLAMARRFGLIVTGGSDYHGPGRLGTTLGGVYVPTKVVKNLKAARDLSHA